MCKMFLISHKFIVGVANYPTKDFSFHKLIMPLLTQNDGSLSDSESGLTIASNTVVNVYSIQKWVK